MTETPGELESPLSRKRLLVLACVLSAATLMVLGLCSLFGQAQLTNSVWGLRLSRLAVAAVVGAGLAGGGMALQAILRNPLAEPYLLGISSGAGVGVLLGMRVGIASLPAWIGWSEIPMFAFAGAMITCMAVFFIAQRRGRIDPYSLILSGVIVNVFNGAVMVAIHIYYKPYQITEFSLWMIGEISETVEPVLLGICSLLIVFGLVVLFLRSAAFNTLGMGDDVARSAGVSLGWLRAETFVVVSVMAGAAVALAGPVGFVGLIVPHLCRMAIKADFRLLMLASPFVGAMFLMVAETLCYAIGPYLNVASVPVGIATALCGGPFFLALLRRGRRAGAV